MSIDLKIQGKHQIQSIIIKKNSLDKEYELDLGAGLNKNIVVRDEVTNEVVAVYPYYVGYCDHFKIRAICGRPMCARKTVIHAF